MTPHFGTLLEPSGTLEKNNWGNFKGPVEATVKPIQNSIIVEGERVKMTGSYLLITKEN